MKRQSKKIQDKSIKKSNYSREEMTRKMGEGSTRVLIPPEPRELLEKLRKMSGASYQTLTDIAIQQLYQRAITEGRITFEVVHTVDITFKKQ